MKESRGRERVFDIPVRLFATCWLIYALHFATNTVREIFPALSLGDRLSFDVSEYLGLHPDIFELPGRGVYINNNPGASILGAIPYALARPVIDRVVARVQEQRTAAAAPPAEYDSTYPMAREFVRVARERGFDVKFGLGAAVMQAGLMAPLSALSVVVMYLILLGLTSSVRAALFLALLYGFATPVLYRTAQLNQNLLVGHCALFAFALLWRPWDAPSNQRRPRYFLAGLLAGWAVVLDYSGAIVPLVLGAYAVVRRAALPARIRSRADLPRFVAGLLIAGSVLLLYQWSAFGQPFLPAQAYMPDATYTHLGYRGVSAPQFDLLWETAFGMRYGLFTSAPLLLLALYPPAWRPVGGRIVENREAVFIAVFTAIFFLFASANQYGRMQFNSGVRHIVPVTPFLFLLAAGTLRSMPRSLAAVLSAVGLYWSWCLAMYRDVEQGSGIVESIIAVTTGGPRLPWLVTLERMGYLADPKPLLLLVFLAAAITLWLIWRARRLNVRASRSLQVEAGSRTPAGTS